MYLYKKFIMGFYMKLKSFAMLISHLTIQNFDKLLQPVGRYNFQYNKQQTSIKAEFKGFYTSELISSLKN